MLSGIPKDYIWFEFMEARFRLVKGYSEGIAKFLAMAPRLLYSCVLIQLNISGGKSKLYLSIGCYYKLEI